MVCKNCGAPLKGGESFCQKCGAKVESAENSITSEDLPTVADDQRITISRPAMDEIAVQNESLIKIWPDWKITEKLGEGSFGKVYKAIRNEMGNVFESAIKIITIPQNASEAETIKAEIGLDEQSTTSYFRALVDDCVNEIKMMESFKGTQNIVSVEDYKVVAHTEEVGWTIFIRMELLKSFNSYYKKNPLSEQEVIKLGIDICSALEYCAKLNVMHRDIKPENIFISKFGEFKLGDFGIARQLEKSTSGMSKKGTYNYMAPEIYSGGGQYDYKSDIYSLGIMLYKLLNNNRFPLIDAKSPSVTYNQMQEAFEKRMSGAPLPKPFNASDALASVVLTACSFNPNDRFATATAMKMALISVQSGKPAAVPAPTGPVRTGNSVSVKGEQIPKKEVKAKKEKKKMTKGKKALIIICLVLVLLLGAAAFFVISYLKSPERKILAALEDNEYKEVVELFKEEMDGETTRLLLNELNERLDQVQTDFVDGTMDYDTADAFLTCLEEMNVSDSELQSKTEEIRRTVTDLNDSRQEYARAEELLQNGDYLDAIEAFKKVLESDPNYADAQAGITAATDKYRDNVLKEAEDFVAQKSYAKAIDVLEKALEVFPEDEQLLAQLEAYNKDSLKATKDEALDAAKKHADEEDYPSAIKTLRNALKTCPNDKDITSTLKTYSEAYVTLIVKEADKLIKEKNFASAIECIEDALEVLPDDDTLTEKLKEANESKPVSLSTLNAFNGGWQWNEGDPTDPFGVTHNDVCNFVIFTDETSDASNSMYTEYRLYGKYNTVSGKLVPHHSIKENGTAQVKLYADDELIYTSEVIGRKTDVILFEANIKGAEYIKIEVDYNIDANNSGAKGETLILMDVQLWGK